MVLKHGSWSSLTAKLEVGGMADDGPTAVDCQTLVGAPISAALGPTDHKVPCYQPEVGVPHFHLCTIHTPPGG